MLGARLRLRSTSREVNVMVEMWRHQTKKLYTGPLRYSDSKHVRPHKKTDKAGGCSASIFEHIMIARTAVGSKNAASGTFNLSSSRAV